jgi:hypothetical protein
MITRLIYFSENCITNGLSDIRQIVRSAIKNNSKHKISGILYHNEHFFLQVLEGGREEVNFMFQNIIADTRHKNVIVISVDEVEERTFKDWGMLYVDETTIPTEELKTYFIDSTFNPKTMSSHQLKQMALGIKTKYASSIDETE